MNRCSTLITSIVLAAALPSNAGERAPFSASAGPSLQYDPPTSRSAYADGRFEFSIFAHDYQSFSWQSGRNRPTLDYFMSGVRLGLMLSDPHGAGMWHGNSELFLEGLYASVTSGPGDWIAGGNLILRRNFIQDSEKWAFFVQLGVGKVWNDVYKDLSQTLIGRNSEFSLLAGAGLRYQINDRWNVSAEVDYRHLSNGDTAPRNTGLDSIGGGISLGYSF